MASGHTSLIYPEQVLISGIVTGWCAKSRKHTDAIQELLGLGDLWNLYGVVGDVEDHLVQLGNRYIRRKHRGAPGKAILDDIDRLVRLSQIAAAPPFHEGRGFKQWTGDDSKALMKVYLPAIEGHVPNKMLYAIRSFLDFCYIARHNVITEITLTELKDALARFNEYRTIFLEEGVREDFSLPRQHSMHHYPDMIRLFGAPNGLCSSITEAKHIKAVKEPWRRSNRNKPLKQMLLTNQRLDKLMAARIDFTHRGMLERSRLNASLKTMERVQEDFNEQRAAKHAEDPSDIVSDSMILAHVELAKTTYHRGTVTSIATYFKKPTFPTLLSSGSRFDADTSDSETLSVRGLPVSNKKVLLFNSASSIFLAPSDPCGIHGLQSRTNSVNVDACMVVYSLDDSGHRDEATGMWLVEREYNRDQKPHLAVVHIDTIFRAVHLLPYFGQEHVRKGFSYTDTLDTYANFYVNKYADHHSFEIL
ncbi:hypothetical protein EDB84DRAFT_1591301 [Lactarius hengduanensis]|nr:hypothetical protein EDB84DRAFT_1591301 [Lactarius hengduanensis]